MVRASSINPNFTITVGLCIANALTAFSGALVGQSQRSANVNIGTGMVVIGLACLIIGETVLGRGSMLRGALSVFVGSILYRIIYAAALSSRIIEAMKLLTAILVALAIAAPTLKQWAAFQKRKAEMRKGDAEMLELACISKTFNPGTVNEKKALSGVALRLEKGDFVTIVGSNGAGKSTLFNAIAGDFYVDEGAIRLAGEDITFKPEYKRSREIGRLFQDPMRGTAPHMTIEENLALAYLRTAKNQNAFFSRTSKAERQFFRDRLALLDMGLEDRMKQPVGLLSGGQRQALTLLMATLVPPKLLLLDEHTAALDPSTAEKVLGLTREIVAEHHITTMMVTHNMKNALELGNRTLMMDSGRVVLDMWGGGAEGPDGGGLAEAVQGWGPAGSWTTTASCSRNKRKSAAPPRSAAGRRCIQTQARNSRAMHQPRVKQPGKVSTQVRAMERATDQSIRRPEVLPHPAGRRCGCGWCSPEGPAGWTAADSRRRPDRRPAPPGDPDAPSRGPRCR